MAFFKDRKDRFTFFIYLFSGLFFLSLETIWIRTVGLQIGSTVVSAALVIAIYFLCAAAGNIVASKILPRLSKIFRWYGSLEILCGVFALVLFLLNPWLVKLFLSEPNTTYFLSISELIYVFALIGLPSFFSGATFPSISHVIIEDKNQRTQKGASPYSGNLWGAAMGVILGGIYIPQIIGYHNTFIVCSIGLLALGLTAFFWKFKAPDTQDKQQNTNLEDIPKPAVYLIIFCSGLFSISLEVIILIYFRQIAGISLHVVAAVLFSFIVGLGLGSMFTGRWRRKNATVVGLLKRSLLICGVLCLAYPFIFYLLQAHPVFFQSVPLNLRIILFIICVTLFLAPILIFVGSVFPLAWDIFQKNNEQHGQVFGRMSFVNKLGCCIGALLAPFVLLPRVGLPTTMMLVGCGYLALILVLKFQFKKLSKTYIFLPIYIIACLMFQPLPVHLKSTENLLGVYQGADGVVAAFEEAGSRHVLFNQNFVLNGTGKSLVWQKQESWIPLILHPDPKNVSFIGLASGISAVAALDFPISKLETVELVPEVISAAKNHFSEWNQKLFEDKRVSIVHHDGRQVIQASKDKYDVVITTLLQPDQDGVTNIYSKDFFEIVKDKLSGGGIFISWIPFYQMDHELSGIIMRTFEETFPYAIVVQGNMDPATPVIGLVGSNSPINFGASYLENRLDKFGELQDQSEFFKSAANFQLLLVGDLKANKEAFEQYPLNTDDMPIFGFLGAKNIAPGGRLRGINYLNWVDQKFTTRDYPSLDIGNMTTENISKIIEASKNYYAARTYSVDLPLLTIDEQLSRRQQASIWYQKAKDLHPLGSLDQ